MVATATMAADEAAITVRRIEHFPTCNKPTKAHTTPQPHTQILKLLRMASRVTPAMMVATCVANILRAVGSRPSSGNL